MVIVSVGSQSPPNKAPYKYGRVLILMVGAKGLSFRLDGKCKRKCQLLQDLALLGIVIYYMACTCNQTARFCSEVRDIFYTSRPKPELRLFKF